MLVASGTVSKRKYRRANIEVSALALGSYYIGKVKTKAEAIDAGAKSFGADDRSVNKCFQESDVY